ncbi:MAG: ribosome silencing factor [Xenococcaceae cyanobacterium MO_207.B15]|nr:ribosome silencing factor [Xenococcaceae cyanobacterium MO_207.B15]MDJ0744993.1 ribosome silencing factor [Xenococcaceae cyanobacterium MO_167.B27]
MRSSQKFELNSIATQEKITDSSLLTSEQLAWKIAEAADDKKAGDIVLLQVEEVSYLTDYFVIATGFSSTQLRAISDYIETQLVDCYQKYPIRVEGKTGGSWVVMDYGEVIAHIFLPQEREYYNLEAFWGHAERKEFLSNS